MKKSSAMSAALQDEVIAPECETLVIEVFADLAELFGNPRSFGSIYGILFCATTPLTHPEIAGRLDLSAGATSQGLAQLESFGAVIRNRPNGSPRDQFRANLELRHLISGFLHRRVLPRLESTEQRVHQAQALLQALPHEESQALAERLNRLARWHSKARTLFPLAKKILGST